MKLSIKQWLKYRCFDKLRNKLRSLIDKILGREYFISFVEEGIFNERYIAANYVAGRIEVYHPSHHYAVEEIRFSTNKPSFYAFREKWDFKSLTEDTLDTLRDYVSDQYCHYLPQE